jgi:phenylalanyl-tRNA synthetase beta chain
MDIKISYNWLRDYLKTDLSPQEIGRLLSYCGPSVEYVTKKGDDYLYDIEVTTNRPDMMSVIGIAREASAILNSFGKKAKFLPIKITPKKAIKIEDELSLDIEIRDDDLCPRFSAIILDNIKVASSPEWMKARLEASGIRSLNIVVDISNYVMLETGQPIHIFDYDKIRDHKMILRRSKKGEEIITIDKTIRKLPQDSIVVEDNGRIIDLCGLMGGFNSAISSETKRVIVFVQAYNPLLIRKTCQGLGFWTEAATRFEKGIDTEGIIPALWRVSEFLEKLAFGRIKSRLIDIDNIQYKEKRVGVNLDKIERIIGVKISPEQIISILISLGFKTEIKGEIVEVIVPSWRADDIKIPEDLIEEIARIYGYHNLPSTLPSNESLEQLSEKPNPEFFWSHKTKTLLKYLGFNEVYNYSFISGKDLKNFNLSQDNCLKIINPLSKDWEYMRPTLVPSILRAVADNSANFSKIKIFELSNIYLKKKNQKLPEEFPMLVGALIDPSSKDLFFEAKGVLELLFKEFGVSDILNFKIADIPNFQKGKVAEIFVGTKSVAALGVLDKKIASNFGLIDDVVVFDLNFAKIIKNANQEKIYKPISRYPSIKMDLAFVVDENILYEEVKKEIAKIGGALVKSITLFDIYRGKQIGADKKSLAFAIEFSADERTLLSEEIKETQDKIIQTIEEKFKAKLRDF